MSTRKFTAKDFEKAVGQRAKEKGVPYPCVVQALDLEFDGSSKSSFEEEEIERVVVVAERLAVSNPRQTNTGSGRRPSAFSMTARDLVTSELLCDIHEREVLKVRNEVFGCETPPFRRYLDARRWLERTEATEKDVIGTSRSKTQVLALAKKLGRLTGCGIVFETPRLQFPVKKKGEVWESSVQAVVGGSLHRLAEVVKRVSKSGFEPAAITWWILLGQRPVVPRVKIRQSFGCHRSWIVLELHAADLAWREIGAIFKHIRSRPNLRRVKVNPQHLRVFQLVRERGGVPKSGKVKFWKAIQKQLGPKAPRTWNAVKKAHFKISKLEELPKLRKGRPDDCAL